MIQTVNGRDVGAPAKVTVDVVTEEWRISGAVVILRRAADLAAS
jgi:hypothetical protein